MRYYIHRGINWKQVLITAGVTVATAVAISAAVIIPLAKKYSNLPSYNVTFKNDDGTVLEQKRVELGKMPTYTASIPVKPDSTKEKWYDYEFASWDKDFTSVISDVTYTATYTSVHQTYKYTYYSEDGSVVLQDTKTVNKGDDPIYEGSIPSKPVSEGKQFGFKGWKQVGDMETGEVKFYAQFDEAQEGIKFELNDESQEMTLTSYNGNDENVIVPEVFSGKPVTKIGQYAFTQGTKPSNKIKTVTLPNSIKKIDDFAFYGADEMTSVKLPENEEFTTIQSYSFAGCPKLQSISIPNCVVTIENRAFHDSRSLSDLKIGYGCTNINAGAFVGCDSLETVTINSENPVYLSKNNMIFLKADNSLMRCMPATSGDVTIPEGVTKINSLAFQACKDVTSVDLNDVTEIGDNAFSGCTGLTTFDTGKVSELNKGILSGCTGLTKIILGENISIDNIDGEAFKGCDSLTAFDVDASNETLTARDGVLYNKSTDASVNMDTLIKWPIAKPLTDLPRSGDIPNLKTIGISAFQNCTFDKIIVPDYITLIKKYAFKGCENLKEIELGKSVAEIEGEIISDTKVETVTIGETLTPLGISAQSLVGCRSLKDIKVDSNNTSMESDNGILVTKGKTAILRCPQAYEFDNHKYEVASNYKVLYNYAFKDCLNLHEITFPKELTAINEMAFAGDTNLTTICCSTGTYITNIASNAFSGCVNAENLKITSLTDSVKGVIEAFKYSLSQEFDEEGNPIERPLNIILADSTVTIIEQGSFNNNTFKTFEMSNSVKTLGDNAFRMCKSLESIKLSTSLETIGASCFLECSALKSIDIPSTVTTIGSEALESCNSFTKLDLSKAVSLESIGDKGIYNCTSLEEVVLPSSTSFNKIGNGAIAVNGSLKYVDLGKVKEIGAYCFSQCGGITSITLPSSLKTIGNGAFQRCTQLAIIKYDGSIEDYNKITKGSSVFLDTPAKKIICNDGSVNI